jgi:hypothetical protein
MKIVLQVVIESDDGAKHVVRNVTQLARGELQPATLGLTLPEAKALLRRVQAVLVEQQVATYTEEHRACPDCGTPRTCKDQKRLVVRSLFGTLHLSSPRLYVCPCQPRARRSVSPLAQVLPERTTPELLYLQTKFAALMSYGLTVDLLGEVLPFDEDLHTSTVRRQVHRIAERTERAFGDEQPTFIDGCPYEWERLPRPDPPLVVGLDGGYVHSSAQTSRTDGWFEVIAGKSVPTGGATGDAKCFGYVQRYDTSPKRRLFEVLKSQGMQMNQQVTFVTDGGEDVRDLPLYLNPQAEHVLDWFHVTMRLTVLGQMAKGVQRAADDGDVTEETGDDAAAAGETPCGFSDGTEALPDLAAELQRELERLKWYLWHGNVFRAVQVIDDIETDVEAAAESAAQRKLLKAVREFARYIRANASFLPNYGDRYRHGETISSAFVESTVNQVVSKRMVKKQQMRWSPRGAHLLLQVRTAVLNEDLRSTFCRWYPGMPPAAPCTTRQVT